MNPLARALFRSFLRWNRRKHILEARFRINPVDYKCAYLFPPGTIIENAEGLQSAIYSAFRSSEASSTATSEEGFRILRQLNDFGMHIKDSVDTRNLHGNEIVVSLAKLKVGMVVQHQDSRVRGVIVGWKVNAARKSQTVQVLMDMEDESILNPLNQTNPYPDHLNSSEVVLVTDPLFTRIGHKHINKYFVGFDTQKNRYIPNEDLLYQYPKDFDGLYDESTVEQYHPASMNVSDSKFLSKVDNIVRKEATRIQAFVNEYFGPNTSASDENEDATINRNVIAGTILETAWWHLHWLQRDGPLPPSHVDEPSIYVTTCLPGSDGPVYATPGSMYYSFPPQPIILGTPQRLAYEAARNQFSSQVKALHRPWVNVRDTYHRVGHFCELLSHVDQLLQLRFQSKGISFHSQLNHSLMRNALVNDSKHIGSLVRSDLHPSVTRFIADTQPASPTQFEVGQVVRHRRYGYRGIVKGYDQRPLVANRPDAFDTDMCKRGQEQPFYQLVVDERDEEAMWTGEYGQTLFFNPHYRQYLYVPEDALEAIVAQTPAEQVQLAISHPDVTRYFLGWNQMTQRFRARHQLKYSFPDGDHRIPDNYPEETILQSLDKRMSEDKTVDVQESNLDSTKSMEAEVRGGIVTDMNLYRRLSRSIVREEVQIYEKIDLFLLAINTYLSSFINDVRLRQDSVQVSGEATVTSLATTSATDTDSDSEVTKAAAADGNFSRARQDQLSIPDIQRLIRLAPLPGVWNDMILLLQKVFVAHSDHDINALVRLAASHKLRGNHLQTITAMTIANKLDPTFFEAYYIQGLAFWNINDAHAAVKLAEETLQRCPSHPGAHALLANALIVTSKPIYQPFQRFFSYYINDANPFIQCDVEQNRKPKL